MLKTWRCQNFNQLLSVSLKLPDAIIAGTAVLYKLELLSLDDKLISQYSKL